MRGTIHFGQVNSKNQLKASDFADFCIQTANPVRAFIKAISSTNHSLRETCQIFLAMIPHFGKNNRNRFGLFFCAFPNRASSKSAKILLSCRVSTLYRRLVTKWWLPPFGAFRFQQLHHSSAADNRQLVAHAAAVNEILVGISTFMAASGLRFFAQFTFAHSIWRVVSPVCRVRLQKLKFQIGRLFRHSHRLHHFLRGNFLFAKRNPFLCNRRYKVLRSKLHSMINSAASLMFSSKPQTAGCDISRLFGIQNVHFAVDVQHGEMTRAGGVVCGNGAAIVL